MKEDIEKLLSGLSPDDLIKLLITDRFDYHSVNQLWRLVKGSEYSEECRFTQLLNELSLVDLEWVVFNQQ